MPSSLIGEFLEVFQSSHRDAKREQSTLDLVGLAMPSKKGRRECTVLLVWMKFPFSVWWNWKTERRKIIKEKGLGKWNRAFLVVEGAWLLGLLSTTQLSLSLSGVLRRVYEWLHLGKRLLQSALSEYGFCSVGLICIWCVECLVREELVLCLGWWWLRFQVCVSQLTSCQVSFE